MFKKYILPFWGWVFPILVAIILFFLSEKKREPVYTITNSPSLIFDKSNSSPKIKLIVDDSLTITENVYVTTLVIWNKGKLPINKEDIRKDLFIYCSDSTSKILDFKILEEKDAGISNFRLIPKGEDLQVGWDHFDPRAGFKFQIIYTGTNKTQINVTGYVLGSRVKQVISKTEDTKISRFNFYLFTFGFSFIALFTWYRYFKGERNKRHFNVALVITIACLLMIVITLLQNREAIFAVGLPF